MAEKNISVDGIELLDFYGVANSNFNRICDLVPKLKLIARGQTIKAIGTESEITRFEERMVQLTDYYRKYGHLSTTVIEQVFSKGIS